MGLSLLVTACAGALPGDSQPSKDRLAAQTAVAEAGAVSRDGRYVLSESEKALDCKKLSGRMQLRILQIRDIAERDRTTLASRSLQSATTTAIGGTRYGSDPDSQISRDRAMLEAYNRQLAAKNCKTFDLAEELKPKAVAHTPRPSAAPSKN